MSWYPWTVLFQSYISLYLFSHNAVHYIVTLLWFSWITNYQCFKDGAEHHAKQIIMANHFVKPMYVFCYNIGLLFTPHSSLAILFPTHSCSGTPGGAHGILIGSCQFWCQSTLCDASPSSAGYCLPGAQLPSAWGDCVAMALSFRTFLIQMCCHAAVRCLDV